MAVFLVFVLAGLNLFGSSQFGKDKLRQAADAALTSLAGVDVDTSIGQTSIALDSSRFIALQVSDVTLTTHEAAKPVIDAGRVRFGIRFLPLLTGHIKLGSVTLEDARIRPRLMPDMGGGDWTAGLRDARGLIDPDKVLKAAFGEFHRAFDAVNAGSTRDIRLRDVEFVTPDGPMPKGIRIEEARLSRSITGGLVLSAQAHALGMDFTLEGAAKQSAAGRITALHLDVNAARPETYVADEDEIAARHELLLDSVGSFNLGITGAEGANGQPARLNSTVSFTKALLDFGEDGVAAIGGNINASLVEGAGKIEFSQLRVASGNSEFNFHGAVGPLPQNEPQPEGPAYRYDFVSDGSVSAPEDSSEPALPFYARITGRYNIDTNQLIASQIGVRTGPGELLGTGSMTLVKGKAPAMFLALTIPSMPVQHIKQLWPWLAAPGARRWVLANLFAGNVKNSNLQFHVAAGRLGNGVPLSDKELSGHFEVNGTRFDITGNIPPVRDGDGVVDFKGTSVDITLSAGTVYMPSGRTVAASNGVFTLRDVNVQPVIGALDIDVAGKADAVSELASYDPINAMDRLDMKPEDFSGDVSGHVTAQVPLSKDVRMQDLDWKVVLDYSGLSVAKPFDGQMVTAADGKITVEPDRAVIDAKAKLNGIPADIALTQPLGDHGPPKQRKITLALDDEAREALLPGLSDMLSGPVSVAVDNPDADGQPVTADLTDAKLIIPWAGWSKGAGIPASVSFELATDGKNSTLSDFRLTGKSFSARGTIKLSDNALSSARFSSVKLNADDDFALDIDRNSAGYKVKIKGDMLDARSLIKNVLADPDSASAKTAGGKPINVAVDADLGGVAGFNGEVLRNVDISYQGTGSNVGELSVDAATGSGADVKITNSDNAEGRSVSMLSADAGSILRFLDLYEHMQGGRIKLSLAGQGDGPLTGELNATNFTVVDEPRLKSIVGSTPALNSNGRSLNDAVPNKIDVSKVRFERGFAQIEKGDGYLKLSRGVLRGPEIGTTFQGTLYDKSGNMDMTGTFMPAYGVNRIFGEIPLFGMILGNGRDRGLIGITYRLAGDAKSPKLQVNPISAIAPGIFRSIFEFH